MLLRWPFSSFVARHRSFNAGNQKRCVSGIVSPYKKIGSVLDFVTSQSNDTDDQNTTQKTKKVPKRDSFLSSVSLSLPVIIIAIERNCVIAAVE